MICIYSKIEQSALSILLNSVTFVRALHVDLGYDPLVMNAAVIIQLDCTDRLMMSTMKGEEGQKNYLRARKAKALMDEESALPLANEDDFISVIRIEAKTSK